MFDIGFFEIALIAIVCLLVVGPNEFPTLVRNIGSFLGKVKHTFGSLKEEFDQEIRKADEIKKQVDKQMDLAKLHETIEKKKTSAVDAFKAVTDPLDVPPPKPAKKTENSPVDDG